MITAHHSDRAANQRPNPPAHTRAPVDPDYGILRQRHDLVRTKRNLRIRGALELPFDSFLIRLDYPDPCSPLQASEV